MINYEAKISEKKEACRSDEPVMEPRLLYCEIGVQQGRLVKSGLLGGLPVAEPSYNCDGYKMGFFVRRSLQQDASN